MSTYKLPDDLYGYQKEDSERMASNDNWLNLSEMGVGKTPTTLGTIEKMGYRFPLIVCPNSLRLEWRRQIEQWTDEKAAVTTSDSYTKLGPILYSYRDGIKYKIMNYETLRAPHQLEILENLPFDVIVFDEIHKLRNPNTKQVKGEKDKLTGEHLGGTWKFMENRDVKVIGLSGSPIMNYPNDLYVPLSLIDKEAYPRTIDSWKQFMYRYCNWAEGRWGNYVYGVRNMPELREKMAPFTIRRMKKDVLPFLPEKYFRRPLLEMKADQRKVYNQMVEDLRVLLDTGETLTSPSVLAQLTRLRQINIDPKIVGVTSSSAKTEFLMDLVESTDEKIVIFSCFEKYIYLLSTIYFKDIPHTVVTGEVPPEKRSEKVKQFQEDPNCKLFLGTIQCAGEGITLTAASNVVLMDRWWNEPTNQQAIDRLHRIGQKNPVQVLLPVVQNSVDELLDSILQKKHELSQAYYNDSEVKGSILDSIRRGI